MLKLNSHRNWKTCVLFKELVELEMGNGCELTGSARHVVRSTLTAT